MYLVQLNCISGNDAHTTAAATAAAVRSKWSTVWFTGHVHAVAGDNQLRNTFRKYVVSFCKLKPLLSQHTNCNPSIRRRPVASEEAGFVQTLESPGILLFRIPGPGKSWKKA